MFDISEEIDLLDNLARPKKNLKNINFINQLKISQILQTELQTILQREPEDENKLSTTEVWVEYDGLFCISSYTSGTNKVIDKIISEGKKKPISLLALPVFRKKKVKRD